MAMSRLPAPDITSRPVLASFDTYAGAQKCVDTLSDQKFTVQNVAIVGVDLRTVETVLGRLSWGRAAASGLASGAWFGVLIGLFVSFFANSTTSTGSLILLGLLYGAAFGIVFGLVSYGLTGGRRDFTSRQALLANRYDVLCTADSIGEARRMLGLSGWPPAQQASTAQAPTDARPPVFPGVPPTPPGDQPTSPGVPPTPPAHPAPGNAPVPPGTDQR